MKRILNLYRASLRPVAYGLLLLMPVAQTPAHSRQTQCQVKLYRHIGEYLHCRMNAEAALAKGQNVLKNEHVRKACDDAYKKAYHAALKLSAEGCPAAGDTESGIQSPLEQEVRQTVGEVRGMVAGTPPDPVPGQLTLYNHCTRPIKIMSPTSSTINGTTLQPYDSTFYPTAAGGGLGQNTPNTFLFAPITTDAQCAQVQCGNWTDIRAAGQRMGYMWMNNTSNNPPGNDNLVYAAYCQPTNAAAGQCTTTSTTPCCGSQMNYDKTFGTTFEITPNGGATNSQDFVDLSTNYGSGPTSPPTLCGTPGADANNCVSATANLFFNVPIGVTMSNGAGCTFPQGGSDLTCTDVSCPDAYQYPEDNKQVACPAGTGYVVTLCPGTHQLPALAQAGALQNKITVQNNLSKSSPCANGNTVSIFTSGGQQVVQPGGGSVTLQGDYSAYPGLGLQVNNWYWTSEDLPVQKGPPQNPDNSGAQFMISDQCVLSQAPPVYGEGIETYKISTVTAQKKGTNECLITIDESQPYTDAVTPGCCAPPLQNMGNVCTGPWGVTNNQQPWPPQ
ncbi:glycoside hydrolase 64/thaumatin family protein [Methylococcus geothermalis]|uniref:Uncharacterized protein n=1 Tax=Methylococcus geothermalis TaxID=2681310 RepID=A0A858QA91_9GAMM|nr:hypothetical protein [Methylococcus geothermalis]QJD30807.1 hypothetical protein GNH96_13090 [Methylococcus geothermalis]